MISRLSFIFVFCLALFIAAPVWSGGLYLQEFATPSTGTASAGDGAWAHDASTAFHNPAGMTRIDGNQLMVGAGVLSTSQKFEADPATPASGGNGGDAGDTLPMGSGHLVYGISDQLKLGVSLVALAGAGLDYNAGWTGRYQCDKVEIMTMFLNSTLGLRVNDWWSIGGGFAIAYGDLELEVSAPRPGPLSDGQLKIDGDDTQATFNFGTMFELGDKTRLGLVYWYETEMTFSGGIQRNPAGVTAAGNTHLIFPQWARASIYHAVTDKLALLGSVGWEDWSALGDINISTENGGVAMPRNWKDTYVFAAGLHYRIAEPWLLQCGISYNTSPVDAQDRTADMPVDEQIRYAAGALYAWSDTLTIGGALEYVDFGDAKITANNLIGNYETNDMIVASLSFNWKW